MRAVTSIAGKELRALFQSQIAVLFLALFEVSTLFSLFALSRFFARNLADLTPFFTALPLQLILLVSATSMRAWAEERKSGTLEVLMTLPVRTVDLVLGKFLAGMGLVALALLFTLPIPFTVWMLGPLDWGPVVGGYVGALLLASAYLAIGLCVSARTDNQVLALLATLGIGGAMYLVGTDDVRTLFGVTGGEIAGRLGTGARFESIARGVFDLRDLAYYVSIAGFFLLLNVYFLDRQRIDPSGAGRARLSGLQGLVVLAALNAVALNVWLAPVRMARIDLTSNQDYSISPVTRRILADLSEPLVIQGIFSERTHPELQPRVPQLRALIEEYGIVGGDRVVVEILDPGEDDDLAEVLEQEFGVRSVPMPVTDRNEARVVNAWFHVLVKYGDQHVVIEFQDLVEVDASGPEVDVRLRDPEYAITRAIRKVSQDFVSTASLAARLPAGSELVLYATPDALPPAQLANLEVMRAGGAELAGMTGNLVFREVDPRQDPAEAERIAAEFGVRPSLSLQTGGVYYLHMVFTSGNEAQRIFPRGELSKSDLESTLDAVLKRVVPGQLRTVAVVTETPQAPPSDPRMPPEMQQPAPPRDYRTLEQALGARFEIEPGVDLAAGSVPDHVDVLIVGKPGPLSPQAQLALDQFLLRGGSVIALASRSRVEFGQAGFAARPEDEGLLRMLKHYGVDVGSGLVLDTRDATLAVPVNRQIVQFDFPYWPDVRPDAMLAGHLAVSQLPNVTVPFVSPLYIDAVPEGVVAEVLLKSTPDAWIRESDNLMPDFRVHTETGYEAPTAQGVKNLAVALTGRFPSYFTDETRPEAEGALTTAVAEGRLVVIGSNEMVGDVILDYARNPAGRMHANNELLLENLVDWALADTDLLSIRSPGQFSRTLLPLDEDTWFQIELANYALVLVPLPILYLVSRSRRRAPRRVEVSA